MAINLPYPLGSFKSGSEADDVITSIGDTIRRRQDPLFPPEDVKADPWLVPDALWKQAQTQEIRNRADSLGIRHDTADIATTFDLQAQTESLLGPMHPKFTEPSQEVRDAWSERNRALSAISEMKALYPDTSPDVQPPPISPTEAPKPSSGASFLGKVAGIMDKSFDGPKFIAGVAADLGATMAAIKNRPLGMITNGRAEEMRLYAMDKDFYYNEAMKSIEESPRAAKIFIEQLSPGNIGLTLATGGLASVLKASPTRGGQFFGKLLEPLGNNLEQAALMEATAGTAGRVGWEAVDDDAPWPLKLAAGAGATMLATNPKAMIGAVAAGVKNGWLASLKAAEFSAQIEMGDAAGAFAKSASVPSRGLINVPDVIPVERPAYVTDALKVSTRAADQQPIEMLTSALERAKNFVMQTDTRLQYSEMDAQVPTGAAHALQRAEQSSIGPKLANIINGATDDPVIRQALVASKQIAAPEYGARVYPSRINFLTQLEEMFGSTRNVPESMQYIGPKTRTIWGVPEGAAGGVNLRDATPETRGLFTAGEVIQAAEHPMTGSIHDASLHPDWYDWGGVDREKFFSLLDGFNQRNTKTVEAASEYGARMGLFGESEIWNGANRHFPTINNVEYKVGPSSPDPRAMAISGRLKERTYGSIEERFADASQKGKFEPELDYGVAFTALDEAKANAVGSAVFRLGIGGSRKPLPGYIEVPALADDLGAVYLPTEQAEALSPYLTNPGGFGATVADWLVQWKNTHLNADFSPLTIQGSLGTFASPMDAAAQIIEGLGTAQASGGGLLYWASPQGLADAMTSDPAGWVDFFSHMGITPSAGTPAEFRTGLIEKIPGIGSRVAQMNDGTMTLLTHWMKREYSESVAGLIGNGETPEAAKHAAADVVRMIIPMTNNAEIGLTPTRALAERALTTSASFVRQPAAFSWNAAVGTAKLLGGPVGDAIAPAGTVAQWARLTPKERLATQMFYKTIGSITALSLTTAILTAEDRGLTKEEAATRNLPGGPDFWRLHLSPEMSIPIGGALRSLAQAVIPGENGIPFANLPRWANSKITVGIGTGVDLLQNEDFTGQKIYDEHSIKGFFHALGYAARQTMPVSIGEPIDAALRGDSFGVGAQRTIGQVSGANITPPSAFEQMERTLRIGARDILGQDDAGKAAAGMTEQQVTAATGARTIAELREKIGTRAANLLVEQNTPAVKESTQQYFAELERRAANGDPKAQALMASIEARRELGALQIASTDEAGTLDKASYRAKRGDIMNRLMGKNDAFKEELSQFKSSTNEIDQLSSQWYELFDKATTRIEVGGKQIDMGVDYNVFNQLEDAFFNRLGPDKAALVEANVQAAPRGSNAAELDLRETRGELTSTGFFDIEQQTWTQARTQAIGAVTKMMESGVLGDGMDEDQIKRIGGYLQRAQTYQDFRKLLTQELSGQIATATGMKPETAIQLAKNELGSLPDLQAIDDAIRGKKIEWALKNQPLAEKAIQWGYLSAGESNIIASGAAGTATAPAPASAPESAVAPEPLPERQYAPEPVPDRSTGGDLPNRNITPEPLPDRGFEPRAAATGNTRELANIQRDFLEHGLSYSVIGEKYGRTKGAIEQLLRRQLGESPAAVRARRLRDV